MEIPTCMHHIILSVNEIEYYLHAWLQTKPTGGFQWGVCQVFTHHYFSSFAYTFCHGEHDTIQILPWDHIAQMQCNTLDHSYLNHTGLSIFDWLHSVFDTIHTSTKNHDYLHLIMLWVPL